MSVLKEKRRSVARCPRDEIGRTEIILSPTLIPLRIVANYTNFRKGMLHKNRQDSGGARKLSE